MFVGHFAAGFAAKMLAPDTSLGTLFLAAQLADLMWPALLLLGHESVRVSPDITGVAPLEFVHYPISHSLIMTCIWGGTFAALYWLVRRNAKAAAVIGSLVVSHWFLDLVVHRPDLPLFPGDSLRLGLGLWNSLVGTLLVEGGLFAGSIAVYTQYTRARIRAGSAGLWTFVLLLATLWMGNIFGPPPPNEEVIAWAGNATWLPIAAGYWIDRRRTPRRAQHQNGKA